MNIINGQTKLLGVIGDPIHHTQSPQMHNKAAAHVHQNYVYVPFEVKPDQLAHAIQGIKALNIRGVNVTVPHKEAIIPFINVLDPKAKRIGAVNTVVNINGVLHGYNTDGDGFIYSLHYEGNISLPRKRIMIIGAGGSAKAIAFSLAEHQVGSILIVNRTIEKAKALAKNCPNQTSVECDYSGLTELHNPALMSEMDIVINTTSIGLNNTQDCPFSDFSWIRPGQVIYDIIYSPPKTKLLTEAQKRGATIINGAAMLAAQGILAFELFTKIAVPFEVMKNQLHAHTSSPQGPPQGPLQGPLQ